MLENLVQIRVRFLRIWQVTSLDHLIGFRVDQLKRNLNQLQSPANISLKIVLRNILQSHKDRPNLHNPCWRIMRIDIDNIEHQVLLAPIGYLIPLLDHILQHPEATIFLIFLQFEPVLLGQTHQPDR